MYVTYIYCFVALDLLKNCIEALSLEYSGEQEHMLPPSGSGIFMGCHIICILCNRKVIYSPIIMTYS